MMRKRTLPKRIIQQASMTFVIVYRMEKSDVDSNGR